MVSEMCIRDRRQHEQLDADHDRIRAGALPHADHEEPGDQHDDHDCLLYTSDAADERSSVDLGGRRIIKKKKKLGRESRAIIETCHVTYTLDPMTH